ncbi:hypothetical protein BGX30_006022 [Mortierella sp. GBA39]|nr:hypothetical protein BGX30_006022 [Mortierella sp. GBA39]
MYCSFRQTAPLAAAPLIRESSTAGLTKLSLVHVRWNQDLFSAIATQPRTLKALRIIWSNLIHKYEENTTGARLVIQLLDHCRRLEKFKIMDVPTNCQTILDVWGSKDWKCFEFETFELDFYRRQPDDGEDSSNESRI